MYKKTFRKGKGKGKPRSKSGFKGKRMTKRAPKTDYATVNETIEDTININQGLSYGFRLNACQRAQEVAHAYKYYRLSKVEVIFVPYSNISQIGGGSATQLPQLYKTVDRVINMNISPNEGEMLERGIKPVLFNKMQRLAFKPNLLQLIQLSTNQPADGTGAPLGINVIGAENSYPIFDKWLPTQQSFNFSGSNVGGQEPQTGVELVQNATNPYDIWYYGVTFLAAQDNALPTAPCGDIQMRLTWEFKGARSICISSNPTKLPVGDFTTISGTAGYTPNTQPTDYGKVCESGATGTTQH